MGIHVERWSRAKEEMPFYDKQIIDTAQTALFQSILAGTATPILDPKTQLFKDKPVEKKVVRKRAKKDV